ncbi:hypothetical protein [Burkholderia sp. Nafp2/4-1b]|uniref:hypothetical protein n=1 Tax=Burkholderia sp. Nafp2/4-1b TaxID=2116686 RepID=UPI0013CEC315|nr:hypothetical protein [Burkholderia sp. Nafp2/4-1b]
MSFFTSILLLERQFMRSCRQRRACTSHGSNVAKTRPSRVAHLLQIAIPRGRGHRAATLRDPVLPLAGRAIPSDQCNRGGQAGQSYRLRYAQRGRLRNERLQIRDKTPTLRAGRGVGVIRGRIK